MIVIDIEASGLGDEGYPIEVAWVDRRYPERRDSFLIRPGDGWNYWDTQAQDMHGIDLNTLRIEGIDVAAATERLAASLEGEVVYSDAVGSDRPWMMKLFRAGGRTELPFRFAHLQSLLPPEKVSSFFDAKARMSTHHRALQDVEQMIQLLARYAPL